MIRIEGDDLEFRQKNTGSPRILPANYLSLYCLYNSNCNSQKGQMSPPLLATTLTVELRAHSNGMLQYLSVGPILFLQHVSLN